MYIADLHIHSKYSRATSRDCDTAHLDFWARRKGIQLLGTGDFTHSAWRAELAEKLIPAEDGCIACGTMHVCRILSARQQPHRGLFCPGKSVPSTKKAAEPARFTM